MSWDHTWLKGVPMDLRPRYFPKPPLRFKDIDIYIPLDAIENDYDFTEERRVLAECKMWEDDKEKERLAREEEERIREISDAEERLRLEEQERLEREEAEAAGIAALAAQAEAELQKSQNNQDISPSPTTVSSSLAAELSSTLELSDNPQPPPTLDNLDNTISSTSEDSSVTVGNNVTSAGSSHQESPTSEDNSVSSQSHSQSQPYPYSQEGENVPVVSPPPAGIVPQQQQQQTPYPVMNGYHYMHPVYHQQQQPPPQYYSYYMTAPAPIVAPPPPQYPQQLPPPPQTNQVSSGVPGACMMYQPQQHPQQTQQQTYQPVAVAPAPAPPVTAAVAPVVQTPTSSSSSAVTPSGPCGTGGESSASGTSSPTGDSSEKAVCVSSSTSAVASVNRKVDLKDLSDFESDTANPFDNVELKSINDMEVLASVLKNHIATPTGESQSRSGSTGSTPSSYGQTNGSGGGGGTAGMFYHQPTPIYPPVSSQCPYPTWNTPQNGYYHHPPTSVSSTGVPQPSTGGPPPTSIAPHPPPTSHIPSPTQAIEQQQTTTTTSSAPPPESSSAVTGVNSFTKLTFPFLTSMDASASRYPRNSFMSSSAPGGGSTVASAPVPTPHHSQDDIASHNPFLSRYVQSSSMQQHRHQYWPTSSHLPAPQQQQHAPYNAIPIPNGGTGPLVHHQHLHHPSSSSPNSTGPSSAATGTQHALR